MLPYGVKVMSVSANSARYYLVAIREMPYGHLSDLPKNESYSVHDSGSVTVFSSQKALNRIPISNETAEKRITTFG